MTKQDDWMPNIYSKLASYKQKIDYKLLNYLGMWNKHGNLAVHMKGGFHFSCFWEKNRKETKI